MHYMAEENVYYVSLESQVSVNYCLVQCDATDVHLMDVERSLSILSPIKSVRRPRKENSMFSASLVIIVIY